VVGHSIGHPSAPPVDKDEARKGREPAVVAGEGRMLPRELEVRNEPRDVCEVEGTVADHLVGDVDARDVRVPGLGRHILSLRLGLALRKRRDLSAARSAARCVRAFGCSRDRGLHPPGAGTASARRPSARQSRPSPRGFPRI
jgi:hypothetical protein